LFCFYASQVQVAIDKRAVDTHLLIHIAGGRALRAVAERILGDALWKVFDDPQWSYQEVLLDARLSLLSSPRHAHLGRPRGRCANRCCDTEGLENRRVGSHHSVVQTGSTVLRLFSQTAVLMGVLRGQRDGLLLSLLSFPGEAVTYLNISFDGVSVEVSVIVHDPPPLTLA
jgi:hypothetical protein